MPQLPLIHWISQIEQQDLPLVGRKALNLGEMARLELPVPNGFILSSQAYFDFLAQTGLQSKIQTILNDVNLHDSASLQKSSASIKKMITRAAMPDDIETQLLSGYQQLSSKEIFVAVRSSITSDSLHMPQHDGHLKTYLNVKGSNQLIDAVRQVWASMFDPKSIYMRIEHGQDHFRVGMAVILQRMVESEVSGIVFSINPVTNNDNVVTVEAAWGLGESIANGEITPDHYEIEKKDWRIVKKEVVRQEWQLMKSTQKKIETIEDANIKLPVSVGWQKKQKLSDRNIVDLAKISQKLEAHFGHPQDTEWVYASNTLYIVQTQPAFKIPIGEHEHQGSVENSLAHSEASLSTAPLLSGGPGSAGQASGEALVAHDPSKFKKIKAGVVLVVPKTDSHISTYIDSLSALVTDEGGATAPVVLAAREKGIPVVVGTVNGTKMIKSGETITVDGTAGLVYEGVVTFKSAQAMITSENAFLRHAPSPILGHLQKSKSGSAISQIHTATKVYINLTEPDMAQEFAEKDIDGVGLLRAEYMIKQLGEHPGRLIKKKKADVYVDAIYEGVKEVAKAFAPRPIIYRFSDLTANQYRKLNGGDEHESIENNPDIGYRGAYRYIAEPEVFKLEIQAIKRVRQYYKNVWVMAPFVRTPNELVEIKSILSEEGLYRGGSFKLFMMAEVPSNVFLLDQFIGAGIDGISVGSNDLTQLILGLDRRNPRVAAGFDERQESVMLAMEQLVTGAARHGIMCSICGQAPSAYPELTRQLVEWGITSVSVSPEAATTTRRIVADAEFDLVRSGKRIKRKGL